MGKDIVAKQKNAKWGDAFLTAMSKDLQKSFPDMSVFSVQNLKSIRYWYKFYNSDENGLQPVSQKIDRGRSCYTYSAWCAYALHFLTGRLNDWRRQTDL